MISESQEERSKLYQKATQHLSRRDKTLREVIRRVGPCTLTPRFDEPLTLLVRCVISQQLSVKAAETITQRLYTLIQGPPVEATRLASLSEEQYRSCGISGPKQRAIRSILQHVAADPNFLQRLPTLPDEEFRTTVTQIKGLGPWSADMLLMFGLGRTDVLPVGDLGFRMGVKETYGFEAMPTPAELQAIAEPWRPFRSIATWYMWRTRG